MLNKITNSKTYSIQFKSIKKSLIRNNLIKKIFFKTECQYTLILVRFGLGKLVAFDSNFGDSTAKPVSQSVTQQAELESVLMKSSYAEAIIPLGDRPELRNKYSNFQKQVRYGRLLEDLDTMAVHISYLHNKSQCVIDKNAGSELSPIVIVTGSVDQIHIVNNRYGIVN